MKPPSFAYVAPASLDHALALLAEHGDAAKPLAGGQSLIPTMNFRLAQPTALIDLNDIAALQGLAPTAAGGVRVGAMTRQRTVERSPLIAERVPLVHETMPYIAHVQIRNRGTFGGNLAHADPASELPAVTRALGARFLARSVRGERWLAAEDFFVGLFATALEPDELLVAVELPPLPPRTGWAVQEMARQHGNYALVGATAVLTLTAAGQCAAARLVFWSVGETPMVAQSARKILAGETVTADLLEAAAEAAARHDIDPQGDIHATPAYRRHLARVLARRVLAQAWQRAGKLS